MAATPRAPPPLHPDRASAGARTDDRRSGHRHRRHPCLHVERAGTDRTLAAAAHRPAEEPGGTTVAQVNEHPEILLYTRIRKSPYFYASRRHGVQMFSVYNHTYHPRHYGDPVAEYWELL